MFNGKRGRRYLNPRLPILYETPTRWKSVLVTKNLISALDNLFHNIIDSFLDIKIEIG